MKCPECGSDYEFGEALFISFVCGSGGVLDYDEESFKSFSESDECIKNQDKIYVQAKKIRKHYRKQADELTQKARSGDKQACLDIIKLITQYNNDLKEIGYYEYSNDGENPVLKKIL